MKCNIIRLHSAHGQTAAAPETTALFLRNSLAGPQKKGGESKLWSCYNGMEADPSHR